VRISAQFLKQYLDISAGSPYSERKLRNISKLIRELPFLQESAPWNISFRVNQTRLNLYLKEKSANQFNAIIGLVPNSEETGRLHLTVDAQASFQNILSYGESFSFSYQNLQYKSPSLKVDAVWPYLLGTPFGAEGHFDLYKRDTAFWRTTLQLGTRYHISSNDYIRLYYENQSNHLITIDTAYIRTNKKLPGNADVSANGAGAELSLSRTDYRLNPRKGGELRLSGSTLQRSIRRNDAITGLHDGSGYDYAVLYDSLEQAPYQYHLNGEAAWYFPLGKKMTLKTGYAGGWVSGASLFQNELYQIGGFRLLRGFEERSVYASQYHELSFELRLLLSRNSNIYAFSDNAWVQTRFNGFSREALYNGFGIGTTLETKTGLFTITYALGRSDIAPLQFRQAKIHFGYVAYF
jgi:hemolysin activation/secretion protein